MLFEGYLLFFSGIKKRNKIVCKRKKDKMGEYYSNYYGLLFNCPFESELEHCALKNMRQRTAKERLIYYEALTLSERKVLIKKHHNCLLVRENKSLFHESQ